MSFGVEETALAGTGERTRPHRDLLFRETAREKLERWALGTAWVLKPERVGGLPSLAAAFVAEALSPARELPDPKKTWRRPAGLCGFVHDLSAPALLDAYGRGLFGFAHFGPLKWYSPPERCVLFFDDFHIGKRLRRQMRGNGYRVTFDRDFEQVIKTCAGRRQGKWHVTWITPRIMHAFAALHDAGHAHSFEVWNAAGALVGGGYGLALGRTFFTESQFSLEPNTSKLGFTTLNWHLARWGFTINDGKYPTPTILDMGFRTIPRAEFLSHLAAGKTFRPTVGRWQMEADLATIAAWQPGTGPDPSALSPAVRAR